MFFGSPTFIQWNHTESILSVTVSTISTQPLDVDSRGPCCRKQASCSSFWVECISHVLPRQCWTKPLGRLVARAYPRTRTTGGQAVPARIARAGGRGHWNEPFLECRRHNRRLVVGIAIPPWAPITGRRRGRRTGGKSDQSVPAASWPVR